MDKMILGGEKLNAKRVIKIGNKTIIIDNVPDTTTDEELKYLTLRKLGQECLMKTINEQTTIGVAS